MAGSAKRNVQPGRDESPWPAAESGAGAVGAGKQQGRPDWRGGYAGPIVFPPTHPVFAIVERDGVELFFNKAAPATKPRTGRPPGAYDVYLHVRELDAWAARLRERGADIIEGPELRIYGQRELVVRDLNGLIIALGDAAPFHQRG